MDLVLELEKSDDELQEPPSRYPLRISELRVSSRPNSFVCFVFGFGFSFKLCCFAIADANPIPSFLV
jgi:hypothetical protein